MYVYDEAHETLKCVSCPSSGAPTTSPTLVTPATAVHGVGFALQYRPRFLSADGRYVFFTTTDALVSQDTNGLPDAYEYDVETGKLYLLSSGTGDVGAWFADASASGGDVFFLTRQSLVGGDVDTLIDLYDARVNGGLAESPLPVACVGDACQGAQGPAPGFASPSGFAGAGNQASGQPVKAKHKSKPKKKRAKKKRRKHGRGAKRLVKRASRRAGRQ
jgi:hypothetical protein